MVLERSQKATLTQEAIATVYTVFENHRKVAFNIASEASYVSILSGQKLIKNAKNGRFWRVFENLKLTVQQCSQTDHYEIIPFLF